MNAWGGAMFDELADWLPSCGADVLCLQEVTRTAGLDGWTSFQDAERQLPQRANLFADVGGLHGTFVDHEEWAISDRPRTAHGARVIDRTGDRSVTVVHLHGLRDPEAPATPEVSDHRPLILDIRRHRLCAARWHRASRTHDTRTDGYGR